jgi:two-component system sensor histidine kinase YesM
VENSIIHGIEKKRGNGFIKISAQKVGCDIIIRVSDNGAGIDTHEINMILDEDNNISGSFGIRNVNERIRQAFGDRYGLRFYPNKPYGVIAHVLIPAVRNLEEYYVKNDNSR